MPYGLNKYGLPEYALQKYALPEFGVTNPATGGGGDGTPSESDPAIVSYWKLDEGTGTTSADSVGTYSLTKAGGAIWGTAGAFGYTGDNSMYPNSGSGRLETGTTTPLLDFDSTDPFTIYAWVKMALPIATEFSLPYSRVVVSSLQGIQVYTDFNLSTGHKTLWFDMFAQNSGLKYIRVSTDGASSTDVYDNQWHMLAWTKSSSLLASGVKMYVDGVEQTKLAAASDTLTAGSSNSGLAASIGTRKDDGQGGVAGSLDNVVVYDDVRTPTEILDDYNNWQAAL